MAKIRQEEIDAFGNLEFLARQVVEGFLAGLHRSPYHGFSVEFAEHRQYNKGESTRFIDWKLYARTDKLFVKKYEEETNLRCQILLDRSSSMYFPREGQSKLDFSIHAAAALINLFRKQRDAFGLSVFSDHVEQFIPPKSTAMQQKAIYTELERLLSDYEPGIATDTVKTLHEVAERIHKRSLVLLFSDMLDSDENTEEELFRALQHLKFNKHEIVLFHVTDKEKELDLEYKNRPYTFVDMESGERVKVNPKDVQAEYKSRMEERWSKLKLKCAQYKIDLVEADIKEGFDQVLLAYLIKRSKMY